MASSDETASVAFLTGLASKPPLHHDAHIAYARPLVLYIARVPGSRDVILTTVKPREVIITAEDINSSLYYLHAHAPDDDRLSSGSSSPDSVERPPLPPPHRIFPSTNPEPLPDQQPVRPAWTSHPNYSLDAYESRTGGEISSTLRTLKPVQSASPLIKRKPVPQSINPLSVRTNSTACYNSDAGRYLQQARRLSVPASPPYPVHDVFPDPENWKPASRSEILHTAPYPKLNASPIKEQAPSGGWPGQNGQTIAPNSRSPTAPADPPRIFTLIRRDPSTGEQWNVAKISKSNLTAVYLSIKPGSEPIEITMNNSGYDKFAETLPEIDQQGLCQSQDNSYPSRPFKRTLQIEESLFPTARFGHGRAKSHEVAINNFSTFSFQTTSPTKTSTSAYSLLSRFNGSSGETMPRQKRAKQVYSFMSPWNGRCEFSSTMADSIKCKYAPVASSLLHQSSTPVTVSELRFNLPAASSPTAPTPEISANDGGARRSRFLGRFKQKLEVLGNSPAYARRGSEPIISTSRLDLSLGMELAGGGFAGRNAKMGKLIVEHEGMKMLDLLIAANLSLWWKAYEKR